MPPLPDKLPPLTDAQVQAGARPGESWADARRRLEAANYACPPEPETMDQDADLLLSGWISERGLEGELIAWAPGELGAGHPGVEVVNPYETEMTGAPAMAELIPCPYHRICSGHMDPAQPTQDNLCPECFELINDGHEQVELEEYAERMAAESRGEVYVAKWEGAAPKE